MRYFNSGLLTAADSTSSLPTAGYSTSRVMDSISRAMKGLEWPVHEGGSMQGNKTSADDAVSLDPLACTPATFYDSLVFVNRKIVSVLVHSSFRYPAIHRQNLWLSPHRKATFSGLRMDGSRITLNLD